MSATKNQQTFKADDASETDDGPEASASPQSTDHKGGFVLPWHRLFGLMLQDHLSPRGFNVSLEVELSLKRQLKEIPHLINQLLEKYMLEGLNMPYTMEDFRREYTLAHLSELPVEDRLRGLPVEEVLGRYCPKERVKGLPADEVLALFDQKEIEAFLRKAKKGKHSRPS